MTHALTPEPATPAGSGPSPAPSSSPGPPSRLRRAARLAAEHPWATAFALLLAVTLAARLGWGWSVGRRLAEQREEVRHRGEPVVAADVDATRLPDDQNAWTLLARAARQDDESSPAHTNNPYPEYPPFGPAWEHAAAASEQSNAAVFRLAREARERPRAQLRVGYQSLRSPGGGLTAAFTEARRVANTLGDGALYRHLAGDDVEAVERLLDVLHLARAVEQDETVLGQLVAGGVLALADVRAQVIAPGLRAGDAAVRPRVQQLIAELLDDRVSAERFARGLPSGRLEVADVQGMLSAGTWAIRPLSDREVARANADHAVYAAAARESNAAAARRVLATLPNWGPRPPNPFALFGTPPPSGVPDYTQWYRGFGSLLTGYFEQHYKVVGDRRATAASLAAQLYRADHAGRWPARLADLVPDYLPAVPADPYHDDGRPFGYRVLAAALPDGRDRPLVYYDEGEYDDEALVGTEPLYGWQADPRPSLPKGRKRADPIRQYRDLARWMPVNRRYDQERAAEVAAAAAEEAEAAKEAAKEAAAANGAASRPAPDDPQQPDAPRGDAEKQRPPQD